MNRFIARRLEVFLTNTDYNVSIKGLRGALNIFWRPVSIQEVTIADDEGDLWLVIKDIKFDLIGKFRLLRKRKKAKLIQLEAVTTQEVWVDLKKFRQISREETGVFPDRHRPQYQIQIKGLRGALNIFWRPTSIQEVTIANDKGDLWPVIKGIKFELDAKLRLLWEREKAKHILLEAVTAQEVCVDLKKLGLTMQTNPVFSLRVIG